jgi:hypothetical protein
VAEKHSKRKTDDQNPERPIAAKLAKLVGDCVFDAKAFTESNINDSDENDDRNSSQQRE